MCFAHASSVRNRKTTTMIKQLFSIVLRLPEFKGKWRFIRFFQRRLATPIWIVQGGLKMELDCNEWAQLYLAQHGVAEPITMDRVRETLKPGDTFMDVGAHVGFVSLVARQCVGDKGVVIAVEPQPYNCERILRNWELNGYSNLRLHVAAAGPEARMITLPQQAATDKSRLSLNLTMPDALELSFQVPLITLSSLVEQHQVTRIKLLKIDVEGFELSVLQGMEKDLDRVDNIIFESLDGDSAGLGRTREVCHWLIERGFTIYSVDLKPWVDGMELKESNLIAQRTTTSSS